MVDQTAAQVKASQQSAEPEVEVPQEESKVEAPQERSVEAPKPEMIGGVPKVRWDDENNDPTKRKSIAQDPTGVENRKLLADNE